LIAKKYPSTAYQLSQVIGVATGKLFVARTGIIGANDLLWVGNSADYAKMCALIGRVAGEKDHDTFPRPKEQ